MYKFKIEELENSYKNFHPLTCAETILTLKKKN